MICFSRLFPVKRIILPLQTSQLVYCCVAIHEILRRKGLLDAQYQTQRTESIISGFSSVKHNTLFHQEDRSVQPAFYCDPWSEVRMFDPDKYLADLTGKRMSDK